jgi:hypothetical protein
VSTGSIWKPESRYQTGAQVARCGVVVGPPEEERGIAGTEPLYRLGDRGIGVRVFEMRAPHSLEHRVRGEGVVASQTGRFNELAAIEPGHHPEQGEEIVGRRDAEAPKVSGRKDRLSHRGSRSRRGRI